MKPSACGRRECDRGARDAGGPKLLCELVPGGRAGGTQECSRSSAAAQVPEAQLLLRCAGAPRLRPTVVEAHRSRSVMTSNRLRAGCASRAFPDRACRLIGCLHHRRAHGLLVPATTHDVHGEGGAESRLTSLRCGVLRAFAPGRPPQASPDGRRKVAPHARPLPCQTGAGSGETVDNARFRASFMRPTQGHTRAGPTTLRHPGAACRSEDHEGAPPWKLR